MMNNKDKAVKVNAKKYSEPTADEISAIMGKNRSFAMAEAHKRLRTNVMFSFADDSECHVIGITSALTHEGKTTTSINLAYDLMKAGKKVLLIDADMRLSKISNYLEIARSPGLSNMLMGKNDVENLVQHSTVLDDLPVISSGDITPNPTELLSSKRLEIVLSDLKKVYEYIIIDLPPVEEVSDAIIISKLADGMILVVRQEFVEKKLLDDAIHQLHLSGAKIIGFVMTYAEIDAK